VLYVYLFSALGVSIWQGFELRKNYHLSVTPNICVGGKWAGTDDIAGISLINKGIGPAIIKSIVIQLLNEEFDYLSQTHNFILHLYQHNQISPDIIINVIYILVKIKRSFNISCIYLMSN